MVCPKTLTRWNTETQDFDSKFIIHLTNPKGLYRFSTRNKQHESKYCCAIFSCFMCRHSICRSLRAAWVTILYGWSRVIFKECSSLLTQGFVNHVIFTNILHGLPGKQTKTDLLAGVYWVMSSWSTTCGRGGERKQGWQRDRLSCTVTAVPQPFHRESSSTLLSLRQGTRPYPPHICQSL